jgi:hypothetical protein
MRMLDLFCGRLGWSKAFLARGWKVTAVDLVRPPEIPEGVTFIQSDILCWTLADVGWHSPDFICASPPCEQFSVHCMKFTKKKDHPYPELGVKLFKQARYLCNGSEKPHVVENVRCAQQFVEPAVAHAGSFYLWGNAIPPLLPKGLIKMGNQGGWRKTDGSMNMKAKFKRIPAARSATIPPELANCVADYAERICDKVELGIHQS